MQNFYSGFNKTCSIKLIFLWRDVWAYARKLHSKSYYLVHLSLEVWSFLPINIYDKVFVKEMFGLPIGMKFTASHGTLVCVKFTIKRILINQYIVVN